MFSDTALRPLGLELRKEGGGEGVVRIAERSALERSRSDAPSAPEEVRHVLVLGRPRV